MDRGWMDSTPPRWQYGETRIAGYSSAVMAPLPGQLGSRWARPLARSLAVPPPRGTWGAAVGTGSGRWSGWRRSVLRRVRDGGRQFLGQVVEHNLVEVLHRAKREMPEVRA